MSHTIEGNIPFIDGVAITPELAAVVVRDYLLPMFDRDEKKFLKKNSNTSGSIEGIELNYTNPPKTIYAELKLTETLLSKIGICIIRITQTRTWKLQENE